MERLTNRARQRTASRHAAANSRPILWGRCLPVLLLVLVTVTVFWPVLRHDFVMWDDDIHVYENPYLHPVTVGNILRFWHAPYISLYIPLTYTLWAVTTWVSLRLTAPPVGHFPLNPQLFHSLNLLLHLLSVLVVWGLVRLLLTHLPQQGQRTPANQPRIWIEWAACGGALLFAIHPLQVEAVAWITGLKDVLCGLLSLVAIWQYLCYAKGNAEARSAGKTKRGRTSRSRMHYGLATGAFVLALLAKPSAVVVPVIAGGLDALGWLPTWRKRVPALLLWLAMAVAWGVLTRWVQPATTFPFILPPLWARPLIAGDAIAFYLYKLGVPLWLGPDYGRSPEVVLTHGWLWLTGLVPWVLAIWLWLGRARVPWLAAAAGVFVAGILPVLGLVPFGFQQHSTVADRYVYIAMVGPALILARGLVQSRQRLIAVGCVFVLGILGLCSVWQTRYWRDTRSLFDHALRVNPASSLSHNNLGTFLAAEGQSAEAIRHYNEALRFNPRNAKAHNNLANALARLGKNKEAIHHYNEVLRLDPRHAKAHYNLANMLASQGQFAEAIRHYSETLRFDPGLAEAHNNLGATLARQNRFTEAIQHYTEAVRIRPRYAQAHYNLGIALAAQGQLAKATYHFTEVLRIDPKNASARRFLERILQHRGTSTRPPSLGGRP